MLASRKKSYDKPREHNKTQRHYFATKIHLVKAMVFPVVVYRCESWTIKKVEHQGLDAFELWCRRLLHTLDSKEIKPINLKESGPEYSTERTDAEAEAPILRTPDEKNRLIGKDPDAGKD